MSMIDFSRLKVVFIQVLVFMLDGTLRKVFRYFRNPMKNLGTLRIKLSRLQIKISWWVYIHPKYFSCSHTNYT